MLVFADARVKPQLCCQMFTPKCFNLHLMAYPGHYGLIFAQREHVAERTRRIWPKTWISFYSEFPYYSTAIWLCVSVHTWDCVLCGQYVFQRHTQLRRRQSGFHIQHISPQARRMMPNLNQCYNLVRRHCPEIFLSIHVAECVFCIQIVCFTRGNIILKHMSRRGRKSTVLLTVRVSSHLCSCDVSA